MLFEFPGPFKTLNSINNIDQERPLDRTIQTHNNNFDKLGSPQNQIGKWLYMTGGEKHDFIVNISNNQSLFMINL